MNKKILFVDDDPNLLAALQRSLRRLFQFDTALGGPEALNTIATRGPYAVIVADQSMPGMSGVELLEIVRQRAPDTVRVMLTGNADQQAAVDAVNRGAVFRFLNKPCPPEVLIPALEMALKQYELVHTERELLEGTLMGSIQILSEVLGMVDAEALGRGQRLRDSMRLFARYLDAKPAWELEVAAWLSPLGFAAVPALILRKLSLGSELLPTEKSVVNRVPEIGYRLITEVPRLEGVAKIVLYQNKNYDGTNVPSDRVSGEDIPQGARMLKILADRLSLEIEGIVKHRALDLMQHRAGVYDPRLLTQCFECLPDFLVNAVSANLPVRTCRYDELKPGWVLVSEVGGLSGAVLASAGERVTPILIERLRNAALLGYLQDSILVQEPVPSGE